MWWKGSGTFSFYLSTMSPSPAITKDWCSNIYRQLKIGEKGWFSPPRQFILLLFILAWEADALSSWSCWNKIRFAPETAAERRNLIRFVLCVTNGAWRGTILGNLFSNYARWKSRKNLPDTRASDCRVLIFIWKKLSRKSNQLFCLSVEAVKSS